MIPKLVFPTVPFGLPQFTQLKALNTPTAFYKSRISFWAASSRMAGWN
jgi:hypothetical protein